MRFIVKIGGREVTVEANDVDEATYLAQKTVKQEDEQAHSYYKEYMLDEFHRLPFERICFTEQVILDVASATGLIARGREGRQQVRNWECIDSVQCELFIRKVVEPVFGDHPLVRKWVGQMPLPMDLATLPETERNTPLERWLDVFAIVRLRCLDHDELIRRDLPLLEPEHAAWLENLAFDEADDYLLLDTIAERKEFLRRLPKRRYSSSKSNEFGFVIVAVFGAVALLLWLAKLAASWLLG